jgi:PIN domain nuclease of toxin-antitoxin system
MRYIADTHTMIWYISEPKRLSPKIKLIFKRVENYIDQIIVLGDRIIAATALYLDLPLLTVDPAIQASTLVETIW